MDHPLHMGVYIGAHQPAADPRSGSTGADLVLNLGTLLTDMNLDDAARRPSAASTPISAVDDTRRA